MDRNILRCAALVAVLVLPCDGAGMTSPRTLDATPACGPAGTPIVLSGGGWAPPVEPSEYAFFVDDVELATQGPLAAGEQPNTALVIPLLAADGLHSLGIALRRTADQLVVAAEALRWALPCPVGTSDPQPRFVLPARGERRGLGGTELLYAEQRNQLVASADVRAARFEYSTDGLTWHAIGTAYDPLRDGVHWQAAVASAWDGAWDVSSLPVGRYFLRVVMDTFDGRVGMHRIPVDVRTPPTAVVAVRPGATPGSVTFDGGASLDPDRPQGCCRAWKWDFDDGGSATGPVVAHTFADSSATHAVSLTVATHFGTFDKAVHALAFVGSTPVLGPPDALPCRCTDITIRKSGHVAGPDGDPARRDSWPALPNWDGAQLGPLARNAKNRRPKKARPGFRSMVGYAFEVVATVAGDPDHCTQIQLVKSTAPGNDFTWTGTHKDLDLDGIDDIDVRTEATCLAAGGSWNALSQTCALSFPDGAARFGPDEPEQGQTAQGAYEKPWKYKKHPDRTIVWADAPWTPANVYHNHFVALVKGTDDRYCFAAFTMNGNRASPPESLDVTNRKVGVAKAELPPLGW